MYTLIGDIEKRVDALEKSKQERKLRFSFATPPAQPSFTNGKDDNEERAITLDIQVHNAQTSLGQSVYVVGNLKELGNWDTSKAVLLHTSAASYPDWSGSVDVPHYKGEPITIKFCKILGEPGEGSSSVIWDNHADYTITGGTDETVVQKVVDWHD